MAPIAEAAGSGRRAFALKPAFPEAHNNLGLAMQEQGKPYEAVICHRHVLELTPEYPEAHNYLQQPGGIFRGNRAITRQLP